jgi:hypothetical protein
MGFAWGSLLRGIPPYVFLRVRKLLILRWLWGYRKQKCGNSCECWGYGVVVFECVCVWVSVARLGGTKSEPRNEYSIV